MKKLLMAMVSVVLVFTLAACGDKDNNNSNNESAANEVANNQAEAQNDEGTNEETDAAANESEEDNAAEQLEGTALSLADRESVFEQEIGTDLEDGSVNYSGGTINKSMFALPETVAAGETIKVQLSGIFNTDEDESVRVYLTDAEFNNCSEILAISNNGGEFTEIVELEATEEATHVMIASSAYDTFFIDFTLTSIIVAN